MSSAVSCQCWCLFCFCAPDWFYTVLPSLTVRDILVSDVTVTFMLSVFAYIVRTVFALYPLSLLCNHRLCIVPTETQSLVLQFYTVLPPPPPETSWLMVSYVTPSLATVQSGAELVVVVGQKSDIIWSIYNEEQRPWAHRLSKAAKVWETESNWNWKLNKIWNSPTIGQ